MFIPPLYPLNNISYFKNLFTVIDNVLIIHDCLLLYYVVLYIFFLLIFFYKMIDIILIIIYYINFYLIYQMPR